MAIEDIKYTTFHFNVGVIERVDGRAGNACGYSCGGAGLGLVLLGEVVRA